MDEIEFAEEVLVAAEKIRKLPLNQEIVSRFIVSKLYYGAHHLGRLLLKKRGEHPELWLDNVHICRSKDFCTPESIAEKKSLVIILMK